MFKQGDIVTLTGGNNHIEPLLYKIISVNKNKVELNGLCYRLNIETEISNIEPVSTARFFNFAKIFLYEADKKIKEILEKRSLEPQEETLLSKRPGTVLHIDADKGYLKMCLKYYKKLGVPVYGEYVNENQQPSQIAYLLKQHNPDIVVITGHDSVKEADELPPNNYKSSTHFIEAVKTARNFQSSKDNLIIIAGACQSNYEALITAGANIASSPKRILIHALDPVLVSEKISYTPVDKYINMPEILSNTLSGTDGMGGIQTRGTLRYSYP